MFKTRKSETGQARRQRFELSGFGFKFISDFEFCASDFVG